MKSPSSPISSTNSPQSSSPGNNSPLKVVGVVAASTNKGGKAAAGVEIPWAASTSYTAGVSYVMNDSRKVYACITTGLSASSGGPTGTGSSCVDWIGWYYRGLPARHRPGVTVAELWRLCADSGYILGSREGYESACIHF